jgi:carbon-monoxide dehydrogenase small subunit
MSESLVDISLTINETEYRVSVEPRYTLADVIRHQCGLTGTHLGCEHGVCGACNVLVDGEPVRACLMFAVQAQGAKIRTVEGLSQGDTLHALQQAFMDHHALQCGFCTPGFLMLLTGALETNPDLTDAELRDVLSSNLCRCTGYQNIILAARAGADRMKQLTSPMPETATLRPADA